MNYAEFIERKLQFSGDAGFKPTFMPDYLFHFQSYCTDWAIRRGRAALFEGCGMGKSLQELVWGHNVVRHTNKPVLLLTPLTVGAQMLQEAERFGIPAARSLDGKLHGPTITIANYERLHYFNPHDFGGVVADESGVLKDSDSKTRSAVIEFMRTIPYRLIATATPAPNDYEELGNSAESLGEMGFYDMCSRFFRRETAKDKLGWGRTKWYLRGHATRDFWRWVCSWSRAVRMPSDLGFPDDGFVLPEMLTQEHVVEPKTKQAGQLFDIAARTMEEQRNELRRTLPERCEKVAELINPTGKAAIAWCQLNTEGDLLTRLIPDAIQVSGKDSDEAKEEKLAAFTSGQARVLVTKPGIAAWGMNWQHCAHMTFFPSHSFEQYFQAVRRCHRFGQLNSVLVETVTTPGLEGVGANLQRKAEAADAMFASMVSLANEELRINRSNPFTMEEKVPTWLQTTK